MSLRINLGSGQRPFGLCGACPHKAHRGYCRECCACQAIAEVSNEWTNVDTQARWNPDVVANGSSMPMFADGSAEMIVSHHNYEHYGLGEAEPMVKECFRILRPGGSLIVTTPNLRALTQRWITRQIDDYTFCVNLYGAYMTSEDDRHRWLYTPETLRESLGKCAAWSKLLLFDWRTIEGADIAKDWWICGVEAVK